jgi:hypothetical protein
LPTAKVHLIRGELRAAAQPPEASVAGVLQTAEFWEAHAAEYLNDRQQNDINRL